MNARTSTLYIPLVGAHTCNPYSPTAQLTTHALALKSVLYATPTTFAAMSDVGMPNVSEILDALITVFHPLPE